MFPAEPPAGLDQALAWTIFLGGILCLVGAVVAAWSDRRFLNRAIVARGVIIRVEREDASQTFVDYARSTTSIYRPLVEFVASNGARITFKSRVATYPPRAPGAVTVLYDPANPRNARIRSFPEFWAGPIILGGLGLVFVPVGAFLIFSGILD